MCFSDPKIYTIECINWIIKYLILLMHRATMKIVYVTFAYRLSVLTGIVCQDNDNEQGIYHISLQCEVICVTRSA